MAKTCADCFYARKKTNTSNLMCCAKAPEPATGENQKAYWRFVNPGEPDFDWCGEFKAKEKK